MRRKKKKTTLSWYGLKIEGVNEINFQDVHSKKKQQKLYANK